ncbi:MAG: MarR family transcriptional regulator [Azoarcus sp.]|nr:MarR family transcriptional regulator [Azoarcus sp.]
MTLAQHETSSHQSPETIDHETRATDDDHEALRVWLRLLTCTNIVESRLRNRLRTGFESTLPRFDLMAQLDRNPDGLKMRELSRRLMVTGGNVTGLTDKLVEEGLVERRDDPRDRRAYSVHLTPAGKKTFRQMAKSHEGWVIELFNGLDHAEKTQLLELLNRLKHHLTSLESAKP